MKQKEKDALQAQMGDFAGMFANPQEQTAAPEQQPEAPGREEPRKRAPLIPVSNEKIRRMEKASKNLKNSYKRMEDPTKRKGRIDKPLCIAIDEDLMKKVRVIMYQESSPTFRCTLKDVVDEALEDYIRKYEEKNGTIKTD